MNKGGYTLVSLMLVNIALASFTVPGLGKRLHAIGRKRVVLTDINIAGERMKDIGVQVDLDTETETDDETGEEITHYKALIRDVYGYVLSVTDDTISSEQSKDPLELQEEIEDLQDKTQKITRSETATEVDGTLSADVIYGTTSVNSPFGAFDELEGGAITGDSIIEKMTGYSANLRTITNLTIENIYCGIVKNGNKLTIVHAFNATKTDAGVSGGWLADYGIPSTVGAKLYPTQIGEYNWLSVAGVEVFEDVDLTSSKKALCSLLKNSNTNLVLNFNTGDMTVDKKYYVRVEWTFLLGDNLITQP